MDDQTPKLPSEFYEPDNIKKIFTFDGSVSHMDDFLKYQEELECLSCNEFHVSEADFLKIFSIIDFLSEEEKKQISRFFPINMCKFGSDCFSLGIGRNIISTLIFFTFILKIDLMKKICIVFSGHDYSVQDLSEFFNYFMRLLGYRENIQAVKDDLLTIFDIIFPKPDDMLEAWNIYFPVIDEYELYTMKWYPELIYSLGFDNSIFQIKTERGVPLSYEIFSSLKSGTGSNYSIFMEMFDTTK